MFPSTLMQTFCIAETNEINFMSIYHSTFNALCLWIILYKVILKEFIHIKMLSYQLLCPHKVNAWQLHQYQAYFDLGEEVKLVDHSFMWGRRLSLIYPVTLPSHQWANFTVDVDVTFQKHRWEQASAMTPPLPQFTTNSSFNTSAKSHHLTIHIFSKMLVIFFTRLNNKAFIVTRLAWCTLWENCCCWWVYIWLGMPHGAGLQWKHILFEMAVTVKLNLLAKRLFLWSIS